MNKISAILTKSLLNCILYSFAISCIVFGLADYFRFIHYSLFQFLFIVSFASIPAGIVNYYWLKRRYRSK